MKKTIAFLLQSVSAGLAFAFVILWWLGQFDHNTDGTPNTAVNQAPMPPAAHTIASLQAGFSQAVRAAAPAVVYIYTARIVTEQPHPFLRDQLFREFFGSDDNRPRQRLETGLGSGVIVSPQGYILTNFHVIDGADQIQVQLADGRSSSAELIGADPETDLAVLQIAVSELPVITMGHSDRLNVGDVVLAIGNPFGVGQTVTMGIVSATGRNEIGVTTFENFIQTDAAINPGNSGGALIDTQGQLIGINTAIFGNQGQNSPGAQGIGFAIPAMLASDIMQQIIANGYVRRGWVGIEIQDIDPQLAEVLELPVMEGSLIRAVQKDGPADQAGLKAGDLLLAIEGEKVANARAALNRIVRAMPGQPVRLTVWRGGETGDVSVVPTQRPVPGG